MCPYNMFNEPYNEQVLLARGAQPWELPTLKTMYETPKITRGKAKTYGKIRGFDCWYWDYHMITCPCHPDELNVHTVKS